MCDAREGAELSNAGRLALPGRFVLHDVARDGAGRYGQRTRQVHLPRTAASREVAILRADHHLIGRVETPGPALMQAPQLGSMTCAPALWKISR